MKLSTALYTRRWPLLLLYWALIFCLYLPAAEAGFVSDFTGWLQSIRNHSFADYINRSHFGVKSLYQLTQFNTWIIYGIFGTNLWAWHLLFVTWHAVNCFLVFLFLRRLMQDGGIGRAHRIAAGAGLLYAASPYVTEVVVWEPSFHYPQAITFMFSILLLLQRYLRRPKGRYILWMTVLYFLSTFTHELHFLTPWLVLGTVICYRHALGWGPLRTRDALRRAVPVLFGIFLLHIGLFNLLYRASLPHVGTTLFGYPWQHFAFGGPFYYFHLAVWGRFWPEGTKQQVYTLMRTPGFAVAFYALLGAAFLVPLLFFKRLSRYARIMYCAWIALGAAIAMLVPMYLPDLLRVVCDRYTYLMLVWWSFLVVLLVNLLPRRTLRIAVYAIIFFINIGFTWRTNILWRDSARIVKNILTRLPPTNGKTGVYLNVPASYKGIPMIGSTPEGETRLMHNLLYKPEIRDSLVDVVAFNMANPGDGATPEWVNDSTLKVTLNQWGTWWWVGGYGATSYENSHFRVDMRDVGHWYEIIFKRPVDQFVIFYSVGDEVRVVPARVPTVH